MNRLRMRPKTRWLVVLALVLLLLSGCVHALPEFTLEGFAMDSYYRVKANLPVNRQTQVMQWITAELRRLEERHSIFDSTSFESADDGETNMLRAIAQTYSRVSGGAYRVDIAPLSILWQEAIRNGSPPTAKEVEAALTQIENGHGGLDFGSLLKGYAADQIFSQLEAEDANKAMVDLGGTIRVFGRPSLWRSKWRVAVRDPEGSGILGYFELFSGQAVATSGDYERGFTDQGKRYHHIIDPRTGLPAGDYRAVSVVAPDALTADILSTLLFVTGPSAISQIEEKTGSRIKTLFVDKEGKIEVYGSLPVRWVKK